MIAVIGILMLVGIVKKNAIMMIDFALSAQREQGLDSTQAIRTACLLRFRPIMMTTFAAMMGAIRSPRVSAPARSCASRSASPWSGGLLFSQVITLFITPVIYLYSTATRQGARSPRSCAPPRLRAGPTPRSLE
jgi:HAE1 family hydrophobic/amphiphilic exporter-1